MALGLGSNMIVRDGGVPGVTVRLGKAFSKIERLDEVTLKCGGGASGILVSSTARDAGIAGLEFLRGIPGTVGGFVRMNGGAYGREVQDILVSCTLVLKDGTVEEWPAERLDYSYRHIELPEGAVVVEAIFRGITGDPLIIGQEMDRIAAAREESQPLQEPHRRLDLQEPAGPQGLGAGRCGGLPRSYASAMRKCRRSIAISCSTSVTLARADIEELGEEVRRRVQDKTNITLEWEIQRIGVA